MAQNPGCTVTPTITVKNVDCQHPCSGEATIVFPGLLGTVITRLNDGRLFTGNKITGLCAGNYTATAVGLLQVCPVSFSIVSLDATAAECLALQPVITTAGDIAGNNCGGAIAVMIPAEDLSNVRIQLDRPQSVPMPASGLYFQDQLCPGNYSVNITSTVLPCCSIQKSISIGMRTDLASSTRLALQSSGISQCANAVQVFSNDLPAASIIDNIPYQAGESALLCAGKHVYQVIDNLGAGIPSVGPEVLDPVTGFPVLPVVETVLTPNPPVIFTVPDLTGKKPCLSARAGMRDPGCISGGENNPGFVYFSGGHSPYQVFSSVQPTATNSTNGNILLEYANLLGGPLEVIVIDSTGCYGRFSYTLKACGATGGETACTGQLAFDARPAVCPDSCTGLINLRCQTNSNTALDIAWNDGPTTGVRRFVCPGEYTATLTNNSTTGRCAFTVTATVGYNAYTCAPCPYKLSVKNYTLPTSSTPCNGTATVQFTQPIPSNANPNAYQIKWSTGAASPTASGLCLGSTYYAYLKAPQINPDFSCYDTLRFTYLPISCDSLGVNIQVNQTPSYANPMGGELEAIASGGSGKYQYYWDLSLTPSGSIKSGLAQGLHQVTLRDSLSSCTQTATVILSAPDTMQCISTSFKAVRPNCLLQNNGSIILNYEGGFPPYQIVYSTGKTVVKFTNSDTLSNLGAGTYSAIVFDAYGCYGRFSLNLSPVSRLCLGLTNCPREIEVSSTAASCPEVCNGSAAITVDVSFPESGIRWTTPTGTSLLSGRNIANLCRGTYQFTGSKTNPTCMINGSVTIGYTDIICNNPFAIDIDTIQFASPECPGKCDGIIEVRAKLGTAPYTYKWNNGVTGNKQSNACPGDYYVAIKDSKGRLDTAFFTLFPKNMYCCGQVVFPSDTDTTICPGQRIRITALGGSKYKWSPTTGILGNPNLSSVLVKPAVTTIYEVLIYQSWCTSANPVRKKYVVNVAVAPEMVISPSATSNCVTGDVYKPISVALTTLSTTQYSVRWEPAARFAPSNTFSTQYLINSSKPQNPISVNVTDLSSGCTFERSTVWYVDKRETDTLIQRTVTICNQSEIDLTTLRYIGIGEIEWTSSLIPGNTLRTPGKPLTLAVPSTPGTYTVKATAYNNYTCSYVENITLKVVAQSPITVSSTAVGCGEKTTVTVSGYSNFEWIPSAAVTCLTPNCSKVDVNVASGGTTVTVVGSTDYCAADTTLTFTRNLPGSASQPLDPKITYTVGTDKLTYSFAGLPVGASNYQWIISDGVSEKKYQGRTISHKFTSPVTYQVTLIVTTADCGTYETSVLIPISKNDCSN